MKFWNEFYVWSCPKSELLNWRKNWQKFEKFFTVFNLAIRILTTFHTGKRKPRMSLKVKSCSMFCNWFVWFLPFFFSKHQITETEWKLRLRAGQWTAGRRRCQLSWAAPKLSERTCQRHASRENVYTTTNFKAKIPIFIIRLFLLFYNFGVQYKSNYFIHKSSKTKKSAFKK